MWGRDQRANNATCLALASFQSLPLLPKSNLGPFDADSQVVGWVCVHSRTLWVSPTNSSARLGVSSAATSTSTSVFNQWFEALFPCAGSLGCEVCFTPQFFLLVYAHMNVELPTPPVLPWWVRQLLPCQPAAALPAQVLSYCLAASPLCPSAPATGLDDCVFFNSLVVGLPYSLIFCQFWLFLFLNLLWSFF